MKVVDLFCGCGGLTCGFMQAGFEVVAGFDNWEKAIGVYRANFDHPVFNVNLKDVADSVSRIKDFEPDMIIGGPPCQDFSSAGKRDEDNGRGDLTVCYAQIVANVHPKWFVMENVERILKTNKLVRAKQIFKDAGYGLSQCVLDASLCGVPQRRKRFVLIGCLGIDDGALLPYVEKNLASKPLTVSEYFGDELAIRYYYRHPRSYVRRGIFSVDEPSPTIRGVNRPMPKGYALNPNDPVDSLEGIRCLTTVERSRIQTFPKGFVFLGNKTEQEQMIGNAVPVNLGRFVANAIKDYVTGECDDVSLVGIRNDDANSMIRNYYSPRVREGQQLSLAFSSSALYVVTKQPSILVGVCRQGTKQWLLDHLMYNYPIADEELSKWELLKNVQMILIKHRKSVVGYFKVKDVKLVERDFLKENGYPIKSSSHNARTKYVLYYLEKTELSIPELNPNECVEILGGK